MNRGDNSSPDLVSAVEQLKVHDHLCLIYETPSEQFAAVIPFIRAGLERGEKCVYIADDNTASVVLDAMRTRGIDVDSAVRSGALAVITKKEAYLREGYFDPDLMIRFLRENVAAAKAQDFKALRATGEMTWALGKETGVERLMEYEAKLNYLFPEYDIVAICQYNRNRFHPEVILDMIRTHPIVIYGNMVCRNMYYVPPDEFLAPEKALHEVERLLRNIKDRELAEEALRKSEAELREAQRIGRLGSWDWDARTDTITWSEEYYRIYGFDPGKRPPGYEEHLKTYTPESAARLDAAVKESMRTGKAYELDLEVVRTDGTGAWVMASGEVKRDSRGLIVGLRGTARDITERKEAERALASSEKRYRLLHETMRDAFAAVDMQGRLTEFNKAYMDMLGYSPEELRTLTYRDLTPEKWHSFEAEIVEDQVLLKGFSCVYEKEYRRKDGIVFPVELRTSLIKDESGNPVSMWAIVRDITERKKAEEALRNAYQRLEASLEEKEVLLSEVHHRVKNNLQTIISLLKLQSEWARDERIVEMFGDSQDRIRAMALVHERLYQAKDFAHIHYGSYVRDLSEALLKSHRLTTPNVFLKVDVDDLPLGIDSAVHVGLIINELITNSLKHAFPEGRGGMIKVSLKKAAGEDAPYELTVGDNGIGIPEKIDFRRTRTMGLYLVTNLAETQLRGRIELSRFHGTEFRIRFKGV